MINLKRVQGRGLGRARHRSASVVAVVGLGLAVVACGSDDGGNDTTTAAATEAPATTADGSTSTAGGAGDWQQVVDAANAEGTVALWGPFTQPQFDAVEEAFETAYPDIDFEGTRFGTQDLMVRLDAEQDAGITSADVVINTDRAWLSQRAADGYLTSITGPDAHASQELVLSGDAETDEVTPSADRLLYEGDTRGVLYVAPYGYGWNTDAVSEPPTFEELFTDETFKGRVGIVDPAVAPSQLAQYIELQQTYPDMFTALGNQDAHIYPTSDPLAGALAAGEVDVALQMVRASLSDRPNIQMGYNDPTPALPVYGSPTAEAEHPNAAQVFLNWALSAEGQEVVTTDLVSVLPDIASNDPDVTENLALYDQYKVDEATMTAKLAEFNEALGR